MFSFLAKCSYFIASMLNGCLVMDLMEIFRSIHLDESTFILGTSGVILKL